MEQRRLHYIVHILLNPFTCQNRQGGIKSELLPWELLENLSQASLCRSDRHMRVISLIRILGLWSTVTHSLNYAEKQWREGYWTLWNGRKYGICAGKSQRTVGCRTVWPARIHSALRSSGSVFCCFMLSITITYPLGQAEEEPGWVGLSCRSNKQTNASLLSDDTWELVKIHRTVLI